MVIIVRFVFAERKLCKEGTVEAGKQAVGDDRLQRCGRLMRADGTHMCRPADSNQTTRATYTHLESQTLRGQITTTLEVGGEGRQRP